MFSVYIRRNENENIISKKRFSFLLFVFLIVVLSININAQSNDDCLMCHEDDGLMMEKKGREISLFVNTQILNRSPHKNLTCVSCHAGFDADDIPHKEDIKPLDCTNCHKDAPVKHQFHPQIFRTEGSNGKLDTSCKHCHGTHDVISPKVTGSKWHSSKYNESCGICHKEVAEVYKISQHFIAFSEGAKGSPDCLTCHKTQVASVTPGRDIIGLKLAQEKLCLSCHLDDPEIRARTVPSAGFIAAYETSIHGMALLGGNQDAPGCVNCHTSHNVKKGQNSESTVFRMNIPSTCGQCHKAITEEYLESVHGISAMKGRRDVPVCTDCHGEHDIYKTDDPRSPVEFQRVSAEVCAPCHTSLRLSDKYGIRTDRFQSFADSYHGLALRGGSIEVANCASCHGVHNIKPSSDPASMVHKDNIVETCGSCHPGANERFAIGKVHVTYEKEEDPLLYWISYIYITLIIFVIGAMFIHNLLDFLKKSKIKKLKLRGLIKHEPVGHSLYLRMTLNERLQHGTMAVSFMLLVITGFMLRFPESWWVEHIKSLSEDAFIYRSLVHRIAGVAMITVSLYHIYYVSFTLRGRQLIKDLFPVWQDVQEAIGVAKFNLGLSKVKPALGRFSYVEKAEYWALIWGTIIMSITGIILWFDNTFIGLLTKIGWDAARTIHYYEAWLAFLAIVIWHFYFVIFNPDVYPMNTAWMTGTISEEEMKDEHPREYEKLISDQNNNPET